MIVTTSHRSQLSDVYAAQRFARDACCIYMPRDNRSLKAFQIKYDTAVVIVMENGQPAVYQDQTRFIFHRGMSELRILNLLRGGNDPLIHALGLRSGMSLLDCTVGLAADALVAAYAAGPVGRVLGLESVSLIAMLTGWGLRELSGESSDARSETIAAASCIDILNVDHRELLAALPDRSFDVVYFDPMFRRAKQASAGIRSLRSFADHKQLEPESLKQAVRVARSRVVIKESRGSGEFDRLGVRRFAGGRYGSVHYGILCAEEGL